MSYLAKITIVLQLLCIQLVEPKKKLTIEKFKGKLKIDLREYYEKENIWLHTKKGSNLI